jgi:hypothetical protein
MTAANFFNKVRGLAHELAVADAPLRDEEILAYLFAGLPVEYDPFVTTMTTLPSTPTLDDVFTHLLAFEARCRRFGPGGVPGSTSKFVVACPCPDGLVRDETQEGNEPCIILHQGARSRGYKRGERARARERERERESE